MQAAIETPIFADPQTALTRTYRADTRTTPPDVFRDLSRIDWSRLTWREAGRPHRVEHYSGQRHAWEAEHGEAMPVFVQWQHFNRHFHELFMTDVDEKSRQLRQQFARHVRSLNLAGALAAVEELAQVAVWNKAHRLDDAIWDPRGKRALFEGLDVKRPEILFLGAADGYEAMQLLALYPGGHAVLVDYDAFCRDERFGHFPERYPFLGRDPSTGQWRAYHREDFDIDFEVADIRDLRYGREFDIVISVGLLEHFPDEHKPLAVEFHRRFLKPGGYALFTTPRLSVNSRAFYIIMAEIMNFGYRELMTARQMGLYVYENGFDILRCGVIKAHNGLIAQVR